MQQPTSQPLPCPWVMFGMALNPELRQAVLDQANKNGFQGGTTLGGNESGHRHSQVSFVTPGQQPKIFETIALRAELAAAALGIEIAKGEASDIQVSRYEPDDFYKMHTDTESSRLYLGHERKLSMVFALDNLTALGFNQQNNFIQFDAGEMVAFPSWIQHEAPTMGHTRHTAVVWVPGPAWR